MEHVGPSANMSIDFKPRLNVLTGDNGLGKSFLLDVAWWCLTRTWAREQIFPHLPPAKPKLSWQFEGSDGKAREYESSFDRRAEDWKGKRGRPAIPGMILYAQVDGGFSVWDPARNYWRAESQDRPSAYHFQPNEVWGGNELCEGLVRDWASWQREDNEAFRQLKAVLKGLSPSAAEVLTPGELRKISVDDPKHYPTLRMGYGQDVPVVFASAGMRRVIALAYLLVWAWKEHQDAVELTGGKMAKEIIFLVDEIEAHLHPQWQRVVVPAVLDVMEELTGTTDVAVQLLTATHSPLVLASTEEFFDEERDAVWELDLIDGQVVLEEFPWTKRGDANGWLTSSVFDMKTTRSRRAENAVLAAQEVARWVNPPSRSKLAPIHKELQASLSNFDPFWIRWNAFREAVVEE